MNNDSNLSILLSAKNNASAVIKQAQNDVNKMSKDVEGATDRTTSRFNTAGTVIKGALIGAGVAAIGAGAASITMANDFNASMANVASLMPGNTARVVELKSAVQDMAIVTGKSTADLADGLYQVVSAFGDSADSSKILETNAKAAAAGLATTTDAINLTSAVTKGYGDTSAAAVQQASDLALQTVKLGQTTFPELAASIGRVTPLAAGLNVTQQELFGTMATFTGVTGGAAEVSTQLRGVLQGLMAPTDSMTKLMQKMGYENGQAMIKGEGLQGTINAIVKEAEKTGEPLQSYIGSIEGQTLAMAAAGGQQDAFTQKLKEMANVSGVTDAAFNEQTQGINKTGFAMAQAQQQLSVLAQQAGDKLLPIVAQVASKGLELAKVLTDNVGPAFDWLEKHGQAVAITVGAIGAAWATIRVAGAVNDFAKATKTLELFVGAKNANGLKALAGGFKTVALGAKDAAVWIAKNSVALGKQAGLWVANTAKLIAHGVAMAAVKTATALWTAAQWALNAALNANPISLIIIAIAALIAAIVLLWQNSETFRNIVTGVFNAVWNAIKFVWDWISSNWPLLLAILTGPIGLAVLWIMNNMDTVKAIFAAAWEFIKGVWSGVTGFFRGVWNGIVNIFKGVVGFYANIFSAAWNAVRNAWSGVTGFFRGVWNGIVGIFSKIGSSVGNAIVGAVKGVINGILSGAENIVNGFVGAINGVIGTINKIPGVNLGTIGKLNLPRLAEGGIVRARPGGIIANIGEGGKDEAVIPLDKLERIIRTGNGAGSGGGDSYNISVSVTVQNDGTDFTDAQATSMAQKIGRALRAQGLKIDSMEALR